MASSVARHHRIKHKYHKMPSSPAEKIEDNMVVKSLSVPPGLEALMEGLTKEVLKKQPQDICLFASEYFAKLTRLREKVGGMQIILITYTFNSSAYTHSVRITQVYYII